MAASTVSVKSRDNEKPRDLFDFEPPVHLSNAGPSKNKELSRRRLSMAGFDHLMQSHRADFRALAPLETTQEADSRPAKRRQGPSKSFSGIKPANLHNLRASYQAVKANAKQRLQTVTSSSKRRTASQGTSEPPALQRPRSLWGLRPSTAAPFPKVTDERNTSVLPQVHDPSTTRVVPSSQFSGAAARQSAREYGKPAISNRSRDDSAFGEHRTQSPDNRESGISLVADLENLHIDGTPRSESVPDIPRHGKY